MQMYASIISSQPTIRFGKPCISGTRIAVQDILGWLASGMSNEEIVGVFRNYPWSIFGPHWRSRSTWSNVLANWLPDAVVT